MENLKSLYILKNVKKIINCFIDFKILLSTHI